MFSCLKKPSINCSAFFVLALVTVLSIFGARTAVAAQQVEASCESSRLTIQLRRGDLTGTGNNNATQAVGFNNTKTAQITIGTPIDLNIAADANNSFNSIITTDPSDMLWSATSDKKRGFKGQVTAEYTFSGLAIDDNKICSNTNSCLTVTNVASIVTNTETTTKANGQVIVNSAEGRVRLTVDVSQAQESGNYSSNLSISLYDNGPNGPVLINCI